MHIHVASDHAGFAHKTALLAWLTEAGYTYTDHGAQSLDEADDYPELIAPAAAAVHQDPVHSRGIIFGGSGQGEAMVANRFSHVRATVYYGEAPEIITLSREHNDANVLSLGARFVSVEECIKVVERWLETDFPADTRHVRRLKKLSAIRDAY